MNSKYEMGHETTKFDTIRHDTMRH